MVHFAVDGNRTNVPYCLPKRGVLCLISNKSPDTASFEGNENYQVIPRKTLNVEECHGLGHHSGAFGSRLSGYHGNLMGFTSLVFHQPIPNRPSVCFKTLMKSRTQLSTTIYTCSLVCSAQLCACCNCRMPSHSR